MARKYGQRNATAVRVRIESEDSPPARAQGLLSKEELRQLGQRMGANRPVNRALREMIDRGESELTVRLGEQLEEDRSERRRRGYVKALREIDTPAADYILLTKALIDPQFSEGREFLAYFAQKMSPAIAAIAARAVEQTPLVINLLQTKLTQFMSTLLERVVNSDAGFELRRQPAKDLLDFVLSSQLSVSPQTAQQLTSFLDVNELEYAFSSRAGFELRKQAALKLLDFVHRAPESTTPEMALSLVSFLGVSEEYSEPAVEVVAGLARKYPEIVRPALSNPNAAPYARSALEQADPGGDWQRTLYPKIDLQDFCTLGKPEILKVLLALPDEGSAAIPVNVAFREGESEVDVQVVVFSTEFQVKPGMQAIKVRRKGSSTSAEFQVTPTVQGRAQVDIHFIKGGRPFGLIAVRSYVLDPSHPQPEDDDNETYRWLRQKVITLENPANRLNEPAGEAEEITIVIRQDGADGGVVM